VIGAIKKCREEGIITGGITCNPNSPLSKACEFPVEAVVGPEFVTGSTRMKAGTAQKLVLNMISTTVMVKLGKVKGNKNTQNLSKRSLARFFKENQGRWWEMPWLRLPVCT
jgi:N-acetylmuramic acid 6-phosphate etherase